MTHARLSSTFVVCGLLAYLFVVGDTSAVFAQNLTTNAAEASVARLAMGRVIVQRGENLLELERRDALHVGDTLITGPDSQVQLRFADGAMLSLRANSKLSIVDYHYEHTPHDNAHLKLVEGEMRSIVGKLSGSSYLLELPAAELRSEGGDFLASIETNGRYNFAVFDGAATVSTPEGELRLGQGSDFDFGTLDIAAGDKLPVGVVPPSSSSTPVLRVNNSNQPN